MSFSFVLVIAPQEIFPVLARLRIGLLTASTAIVTYLFDRLVRRQPFTLLTREIRIAAILAGWAIATVPLSYWPGGSVAFLLGFYLKSVTIFWLLSNTVDTPEKLRRVAWGLSLMAVPVAGTAIGNFLSASFLPGLAAQTPRRIVGYDAPLTGNPNDLALMLNLIIPLSVALVLTAERRALRILLGAVIALDILAVIVTFSRGGFVTLAAIAGLYGWKFRRRPEGTWRWAALAIALASLPFLPSGYFQRLATIGDIDADVTGSAQLRWDDALAATRFVLAHPVVGAGVGQNVLALHAEEGTRWTAVHNVYLEVAVELGLPGLVLFLALLGGSIRAACLVQRRSAGVPGLRPLFALAEGIQVSLVAFAVAGFFHPVAYHLYFYYVAGLAVAASAVCAATRQGRHA
ncbi:MAG: O-antigen ligase family protein [Candidatus Rokubacteria bacterium]|nr:O-antigen ligase family protein [Candidatus Rokubacteria bacterium]